SGTSCARPCHTCLVEKDKLNAIKLPTKHKIIRTENQMQQVITMKKGKDYSLHEETNCFWNHPHMMKVMPFVIEGLFEGKENESLVRMFVNWNKMYYQSKKYEFTKSDLFEFEVTRSLTLKEIYEHIVLQGDQPKINAGKFGKQYCTIPLHLLKSIIELYKHEEYCSEILEGLQHFGPALNEYFNLMFTLKKNIEESEITLILFESFILPNKENVRATKSYYNTSMFSDIAIYMDSEQDFNTFGGYCFAKVLLLVRVVLKAATTFDLALIR
ncbi:35428_t:CDS:2, partial [Racocetra persica]